MSITSVRLVSILLLALVAGCGKAEVGEECDGVGSTDDCEDGAVCTNEGDGGVCRLLCDEKEQCPANHSCNGISGSNLKSCQPDN